MQLFCRHTWETSQLQLLTTHPYLPSSKCCWIPCSSAGRAATHGFKLPMNTECNVQHPEPEYPLCQFSQRLKNKPTSCFIKKKIQSCCPSKQREQQAHCHQLHSGQHFSSPTHSQQVRLFNIVLTMKITEELRRAGTAPHHETNKHQQQEEESYN